MIYDFDKMPFKLWDDSTKISFLQRVILVHSTLYYELNTTVISDSEFDFLSKQLVELQKQVSKEELEKSQYYYVFYDFDGSTGFHLWYRLKDSDKTYLLSISKQVKRLSFTT